MSCRYGSLDALARLLSVLATISLGLLNGLHSIDCSAVLEGQVLIHLSTSFCLSYILNLRYTSYNFFCFLPLYATMISSRAKKMRSRPQQIAACVCVPALRAVLRTRLHRMLGQKPGRCGDISTRASSQSSKVR